MNVVKRMDRDGLVAGNLGRSFQAAALAGPMAV